MKVFTETSPAKLTLRRCKMLLFALAITSSAVPMQAKSVPCQIAEAPSQGEKPTVKEEVMHGKTFVVSKLLVKAKPERVWQILADYNNASRIFPILKECELLEDKGSTKITRHVLAPTGVPDTFEYVLEVRESAPFCMEWHRLSGDFHDVDGYWKLEPADLGRHTLVTYASYVNGGLLMPQFLIRRQFRIDMPNALMALRNKAEIDTRIAAHRSGGMPTQ